MMLAAGGIIWGNVIPKSRPVTNVINEGIGDPFQVKVLALMAIDEMDKLNHTSNWSFGGSRRPDRALPSKPLASVEARRLDYGWPFIAKSTLLIEVIGSGKKPNTYSRNSFSWTPVIYNALSALLLLGAVCFLCELLARRKSA